MKRCPQCKRISYSRFCPDCGYDLSTVDALVCPNCELESTSRFCPNCGMQLLDVAEATEEVDSVEEVNAEISSDAIANDIDIDNNSSNDIENSKLDINKNTTSEETTKQLIAGAKKKPLILGIIAAVVVLVLIVSIGSNSSSKGSNADTSTDSYSTMDESDQSASNSSDYSSSSDIYSDADDGLDPIQGSWELVGVVVDGESTNLRGYSAGSLVISGDRWNMTVSTDEDSNNSGSLSLDMKSQLDSDTVFYIYTMSSDGYSGTVKMTYSPKDDFIAVSTSATLDADNCFMFGR